ncbi:hypothetical protein MUK42_37209 [Musa troglodytarum]|uniref:Uncharacterized protein n=1 Tax=Musa troglodytarum TaxID=320322 RepID=A0A9E7EA72_9LILI|nr:hypothetical protein MUK42_37209 [Musa troglodytarum]
MLQPASSGLGLAQTPHPAMGVTPQVHRGRGLHEPTLWWRRQQRRRGQSRLPASSSPLTKSTIVIKFHLCYFNTKGFQNFLGKEMVVGHDMAI